MWATIEKSASEGTANTREYFHAKEIMLNCLSYIEGWGRKYENGKSTDMNRSDRDPEKRHERSDD